MLESLEGAEKYADWILSLAEPRDGLLVPVVVFSS